MLNNLYQQVVFCVTIRAFKDVEYISLLIHDISNLIQHLHLVSVEGAKSIKGAQVEGSELKIYLMISVITLMWSSMNLLLSSLLLSVMIILSLLSVIIVNSTSFRLSG